MRKHTSNWKLDWKDKSHYKLLEDQPETWAWEFLRRNHKYQDDYKKYVDFPSRFDESESMFGGNYFEFEPPPLPDESFAQYKKRSFELDGFSRRAKRDNVLEHYLLDEFEDPMNPNSPTPSFVTAQDIGYPENMRRGMIKPNEDELIFKFNVRFNLDEQLEIVKSEMDKVRKRHPKFRQKNKKLQTDFYRLYLRYLDAEAENVSQVEVARHIHGHEEYPDKKGRDKVNKGLKVALELVDGGYITLLNSAHLEP
jgi:hypothetical protein